jgi:hypothetical protein
MNDMELEDLEYRLENLRSGANVQNVPVQSNVEDLVERFNQLDGVGEAGLELPQREFDMEPYIIRGMSQRDIAETDRRRRTDGLRRRRAAQTLQRSFRNRRGRRGRERVESRSGQDPRAMRLYEQLQESARDGNPDPVLLERLSRMMNREPVRVTTRPLPSVPLARSIPLRNSPNILDVPYGMADGETDGLLSRMDCPERLQWCQTNRENRENCNREPVLSRYIQPCREKSRLNKSKGITRLLIDRFLTWKIAIKPDSFSEKPPGYIYFQNLRKRGIEIPTNILEFTSSMDIPNDVQTMLFDFLTMEGYDEDPLYGEPNDTIRFLEQLRGAYEHGGIHPRPWDGRRPDDAANAVANANTLIVDFVNGFRSMLLNNTEYSEIEIETFIHKFLSTINLGV